MEALTICTRCKKTVRVKGPDPPPVITQDYPIAVYCPDCHYPIIVIWRKATPYFVSLAYGSN